MKIILHKRPSCNHDPLNQFVYHTNDMQSCNLVGHLNDGQWFVMEYKLQLIQTLAQAHGWQVEIIE